jgi:hypothetical protein
VNVIFYDVDNHEVGRDKIDAGDKQIIPPGADTFQIFFTTIPREGFRMDIDADGRITAIITDGIQP